MNHLVIDIEMCKVPRAYRSKQYRRSYETIQIGAVLLNDNYDVIDDFMSYVRPAHGVIDHFINHLTGICPKDIKSAPTLSETLQTLTARLGEEDYNVFAWSDTDYRQLAYEIKAAGESTNVESDGNLEGIGKFLDKTRWIDYQKVFDSRYHFNRCTSLTDALDLCGILEQGRKHDGLADAYNTSRMIKMLELNPNYQVHERIREYMQEQSIGNSLAEKLTALGITFA